MLNLRKLFPGKKEFRTGVVLSGGGARGYAHAGVLKAMEEMDLKPDIISGVSAGAIVGAMYADGNSPDEMFRVFQEEEHFYKYVKLSVPKRGLLRAVGLEEKLRSILKAQNEHGKLHFRFSANCPQGANGGQFDIHVFRLQKSLEYRNCLSKISANTDYRPCGLDLLGRIVALEVIHKLRQVRGLTAYDGAQGPRAEEQPDK